MKKITFLFFLMVAIATSGSKVNAQAASAYCQTTVTHFNIPAETASGIKLTISKIDATSMYVEIESATSDPVDLLLVNNGSGATISEPDASVSGKIRRTLTWTTAPTNVEIELLWSKATMPGNWMLNTFSVPFDATCGTTADDTEAPTAFTATKGKVLSTSVELLLNATDNSGSVQYKISYGAGPTVVNATGTSATQKSVIVSGLTPSTEYTFSIEAKDAKENAASNNPLTVTATTTAGLTTSAPTPPALQPGKSISIFSDAFTNLTGTNFNPGWGQATQQSIIQLGSDNILKYANFNYQGTEFTHIFPVATGMDFLHVDVWTEAETKVDVFPICWNGSGNEPEKFKSLILGSADHGTWKSFDIPLTDFTSQGLTMTDVYQLKLVGTGGKTVYFDNIYFYDSSTDVDSEAPTAFTATKGTVTAFDVELLLNATDNSGAVTYSVSYGAGPTVVSTSGVSGVQKSFIITGLNGSTEYNFSVTAKDATGNTAANSPIIINATTLASIPAAPTPLVSAEKVVSVYSDTYTNIPNELQNWYANTFSTVTLSGNTTLKNTSTCCFGFNFNGGAINITGMTKLHADIYPETLASMTLGITGGGEFKKSNIALTANQWNSIDITLSELTGANLASVAQVGFWDLNGTFYLDNLYFYNDTSTGLNDAEKGNKISLYPNPVKDMLTIAAQSDITEVIVRNLVGQTVMNVSVNGFEKSVDMSNVAAGNYFVTVKMANGQVSTQKFVKQ
jgi:hypothetical protein